MGRGFEPTNGSSHFDPASLRIRGLESDSFEVQEVEVQTSTNLPKKRYLPSIPESVFNRLNRLPGKCLAVYMILKQLSKFHRSKTVALTTARLSQSGITRNQKTNALRHLVESGFITVSTVNGKNPTVTLLKTEKVTP